MSTASAEFQVFVKPMGAICNLDCHYCYYLEKEDLYPQGESFRMTDDLLEEYIIQHIEACPIPAILFSWHGGEPTALGIDFFRKVVALQRKHQPPGREIINAIQTNGTLLNEEWCRFFAAEEFFVGLSLDGPKELHDRYRVTKGKQPTHKQVVKAFRLLRSYRIARDTLCVVHDQNVRYPVEVYRFFKEIGVDSLQFLPLVERRENGEVSRETVSAEAYGTFLRTIFHEWIRQDVGRVTIQNFDEAARPLLGMEHALCIFRETCGNFPVLEHNGDFFSCDHFVDPGHRIGNLRERSLVEMLESPAQKEFGQKKRDALPRYCRECEVLAQCNGGCPKDRFIRTPEGEAGLNYLCAGLKNFFTYSQPYLQRLAAFRQTGQPIEQFMHRVQSEDAPAPRRIGRNDLCPCGSGKKYKQCCLGKLSPEVVLQ